jgi:hypothetical protein
MIDLSPKPLFDSQSELKQLLEGIAENSKHARNILFALVTLSAYVLITAFSGSQEATFIKLPVFEVQVRVGQFFVVGPLAILGAYLYLGIYIRELNARLNRFDSLLRLQQSSVESPALLLYPWMPIFARYGDRRMKLIAWFAFRWLTPTVLLILWTRFVLREDTASIVLWFALLVSTWVSFEEAGTESRRGFYIVTVSGLALLLFTLLSMPWFRALFPQSWVDRLWNFAKELPKSLPKTLQILGGAFALWTSSSRYAEAFRRWASRKKSSNEDAQDPRNADEPPSGTPPTEASTPQKE